MSTRKNKTLVNSLVLTGMTAFFAALVVIAFSIRPMFSLTEGPESFETKNAGLSLYHEVWKKTQDNLVFTDRLKDWSKWEHKFDDRINSKVDGIKYAQKMTESLEDPYTRVLDEKETQDEANSMQGKFLGVGIQFNAAQNEKGEVIQNKDKESMPNIDSKSHPVVFRVFKDTPAFAAGIKSGDSVVSVNGKSTVGFSQKQLVDNIRGPENTYVTLELQRGDKVLAVKVQRRKFDIPSVEYHTLPDNLGYLKINSFISASVGNECLKALKAMKNCRGIVLDLRDNPGGQVSSAKDVMALFEDGGVLMRIRERQGGFTSEGALTIDNSMPHIASNTPLVVLVNGNSASAAEIVSGALHDNRHVKLVGTKTFGKGLMQGVFPLKSAKDVLLHVTIAQWLTPNGVCPGSGRTKIEEPSGLPADVTCEPGPKFEYDSPKDNQLHRAIEVLKEEMSKK
ncbi:MAG: PDZ domain-containing protein [Candidatus Obscuribacterales bacterium]|nr:PDZ domain-containing protein [Candidatus Obscuribacterales bacterium]